MQNSTARESLLPQLEEALQSPIILYSDNRDSSMLLESNQLLTTSARCCVVIATSSGPDALQNIANLYQSMTSLKHLKQYFLKEHPGTRATLIGIYPSLEYPACVYELNTSASRYVTGNILPYNGSLFTKVIKYLVSRILGVSPTVGGLGLALHKE